MHNENPYLTPSGDLPEIQESHRPYLLGRILVWSNTVVCVMFFLLFVVSIPLSIFYPPRDPQSRAVPLGFVLAGTCFLLPCGCFWGLVAFASRNVWRRSYLILTLLPGILMVVLWIWTVLCVSVLPPGIRPG